MSTTGLQPNHRSSTGCKDAGANSSAFFADVALIDGRASAAVGDVSISWWLEEVRCGRAPAPAVRRPRYTRWKAMDVAAFWRKFVADASNDSRSGEVTKQAKKASDAARAKRQAQSTGGRA